MILYLALNISLSSIGSMATRRQTNNVKSKAVFRVGKSLAPVQKACAAAGLARGASAVNMMVSISSSSPQNNTVVAPAMPVP